MSEILIGILISTLVILSAFLLYFLIFPSMKTLEDDKGNERKILRGNRVKKVFFALGFLTTKILLLGILYFLYKNRALINIRELGGAFLISTLFLWSIILILRYFCKSPEK